MGSGDRPAETRVGLKSWLLVACLVLFYIFSYIDRNGMAMILDPLRADLHLSDTQVSLLIGLAFAAAYSFGAIPAGWLVDRFPRRLIIFFSVTFWGLATMACGLAGSFGQLFAGRVAVGLGEAPLHPSSHSIISDSFPPRRLATVISIYAMGSVLGSGVALILGGVIVDFLMKLPPVYAPVVGQLATWQMAFMVMGAPCLLMAGLIFLFKEPPKTSHAGAGPRVAVTWTAFFGFLKSRWQVLTCFVVAFGGMQVVNGAFLTWQPAYLSRAFHLTPVQYGTGLGLITAVCGVAGLLFSGWMVDRLYARGHRDAHMRYYFWALLLSSPFVLVALLAPDVRVYFGLIWIAKLLMLNTLGFSSAMIQLISPSEMRGRMSGIFVTLVLGFSASALGALVPALISDYILKDQIQLGRAMAVTIGIFMPLALVALWVGRKYLTAAVEEAETWR